MKNFESFVGVDWSGAKSPIHTKSIAVSVADVGNDAPKIDNSTWSRTMVFDYILSISKQNIRTLIGMDCNFGYSEIIGQKQFGKDYTAPMLWHAVHQTCKNDDNFFAGTFWNDPNYKKYFWDSGTRPQNFEMPRRVTEQACQDQGFGSPESPFKLIGAKQVGKGGLSGMRLVAALKEELGHKLAVFPFDDGYDDAVIVITEIYPRLFLKMTGHGNTKIRDISSLNHALKALNSHPMVGKRAFSDHQADAIISSAGLRYLCGTGKTIPDNLTPPPTPTIKREGWIFGVK